MFERHRERLVQRVGPVACAKPLRGAGGLRQAAQRVELSGHGRASGPGPPAVHKSKVPFMDEPHIGQMRQAAQHLARAGQTIAALQQLDQLIGCQAAEAEDWLLTGSLLCQLGEYAQALGAFENCLQRAPQHVEGRYELGRALYKLGTADRAAELIEQVAEETGSLELWMGLATIAPGVPGYDVARVRRIREKFAQLLRQSEAPSGSLVGVGKKKKAVASKPRPRGRLRLGYVSAHWHEANYMKPVWPVIQAHDRSKFEICLFDDGPDRPNAWHWLQSKAETTVIRGLDNAHAAELLAEAKLDILVDLSAYSQPERLGMFVHRPAPIQMAWFNMYATSGLAEFDTILGDRWVLRSDEQRHYSERVFQLPLSYLTFQTNHPAPEVATRPVIGTAPFAFGCLGTLYKITPQVIDTWSEILRQADTAELVLSASPLRSICNRQYLLQHFEQRGVATERIRILEPAPHYDFLAHYAQIDLGLDTFPYNGGTTTMEAVWQGVPVLNFDGDRWGSRTSRSLLANSHLAQFCVASREEYVRTAVKWATSEALRSELGQLRATMRERLSAAKVCDSQLLTAKLEACYLRAAS
jgi:protein O-GlcNAc transferase